MKKYMTLIFLSCMVAFLLLISGCATLPGTAEEKKTVPEKKKIATEEQEKKAMGVFNKILDITSEAGERQEALPKMEVLYEEIIDNYPDVQIAEESYWRLIAILVEEFKPPKVEKAEKLYGEFSKKYPGSNMRFNIDQTLGQFYYSSKLWDRLLRFCSPQVKRFIQTGKLEGPYYLYMYSEAKFNLNDIVEAEKGYKIVLEFFPKTKEGYAANKRLKEIQDTKK